MSAAERLLSLDADDLGHVLELMAGQSFEVTNGKATGRAAEVSAAPPWLVAEVAKALSVSQGAFTVPTAEAIKAASAGAAERAALDQARNPFAPGTFNLTEQITMRRDDPAMADKLQARASADGALLRPRP